MPAPQVPRSRRGTGGTRRDAASTKPRGKPGSVVVTSAATRDASYDPAMRGTSAAAPRPVREPGRKRPPKIEPAQLDRLVETARRSLEDDKAEEVVVLDVTGRADYADRLIVASGLADRQLQAMATHELAQVEEAVRRIIAARALAEEDLKLWRPPRKGTTI